MTSIRPACAKFRSRGDVFRPMTLQPLEKTSGRVQCKWNVRKIFKHIQERLVSVPVCLRKHAVEVADGLVVVKAEHQPNFSGHFQTLRVQVTRIPELLSG
ncbi:MAG UNVERIFIED_CONTAM: hypothetical protein LVR18_05985 [Planctomycetaceae bacterium]|jgi:hypothetical protein